MASGRAGNARSLHFVCNSDDITPGMPRPVSDRAAPAAGVRDDPATARSASLSRTRKSISIAAPALTRPGPLPSGPLRPVLPVPKDNLRQAGRVDRTRREDRLSRLIHRDLTGSHDVQPDPHCASRSGPRRTCRCARTSRDFTCGKASELTSAHGSGRTASSRPCTRTGRPGRRGPPDPGNPPEPVAPTCPPAPLAVSAAGDRRSGPIGPGGLVSPRTRLRSRGTDPIGGEAGA